METKYLDLHIHTIHSDGTLSPEQTVELSALNGIKILAITDHDHLQGYFDAKKTAKEMGIELIPGVEITTPKYHLLGLNFNPNDKHLQDFLKHSRGLQRQACKTRISILQSTGMPISMDKMDKKFPNARIGKGNLRVLMTSDKECRDYLAKKHPELSPKEISFHYLGKKGIASNIEPRAGVSPIDAIEAIHKAGGVIGIAHPQKDIQEMKELEILMTQGIDFLEIQPNLKATHPYEIYKDFAKKNNLPLSFGSDYHGPTMDRPALGLGENILSPCLAKLLKIVQ